ncbi:MAG: ATP-dependent DNA helicase, partial [Saprospiraceae bacterium]|nr:ATP-dependent DNA helicase [Saprospiraceae bacterium]
MDPASPYDILKTYFGYHTFRAQQEEIINHVLEGNDTLALLPTGAGKSLCYQIPALSLPGLTLVVSPLIALMNDQVAQLKAKRIKAERIHSGMSPQDIDRILDNAVYGKIRLLYISPERLRSAAFLSRLPNMPVQLLAVDEAHCVSMWGYDFRPSYLEIPAVKKFFPEIPTIALTATATSKVLVDISTKLELKRFSIFRSSFLRPNLSFVVCEVEDKKGVLADWIRKVKGSAIVYVRNRKATKELAEFLSQHGFSATYYHAGLPREERSKKEREFLDDHFPIIVATNAFGMGIDKSNVRLVVHYSLPDSLEAYYQEAGRAGRDGRNSHVVLLYQSRDLDRLTHMYEQSFPPISEIRRIYNALGNYLKLAVGSGEN